MDTVQSVASAAQGITSSLREFSEKTSAIANMFQEILAQVQGGKLSGESSPVSAAVPVGSVKRAETVAALPTQDNLLDMLRAGQSNFSAMAASTVTSSQPVAAVNREAVTAALNDRGVSSNGLTTYQSDPTSNAWRSKNINDPLLRRHLETLPLSRESTLEILAAENPLAEIGNIYKSMGTYATVDSVGDLGGRSISVRDNEGRVLESQFWMPDKMGAQKWTMDDANALQSRLLAYGIDMPKDTDWSDFSEIAGVLKQAPPQGNFQLSPAGQYERYGFKTDPLTGAVVGGGSTSAIEYYRETGKMPPASAVWRSA